MPPIDSGKAIYAVPAEPNVTYDDVITSLKVISEGMNFVNPANFPIGEHMKQRGQAPEGVLEVRAFCNLGMGAEIMLDHPEFVVFAPCRIGIYEKKGQLYLAIDRPTYDLKSIKNPTPRAQKAAQELESTLIQIIDKARRGDIQFYFLGFPLLKITKAGFAEHTVNKSRFIAVAEYCPDERAVGACLRKLASQHQSAHHLAYAFRLKTAQGIVQRFSDAGEPSGTAGKPILQFLEGRDLINVCVGVIRYYGGINLGTGGLARAYGGTGRLAIEDATIVPYVEMKQLQLKLDYKELDYFTRELAKIDGVLLDKVFGDGVTVLVSLPEASVEAVLKRFGQQ